MPQIGWFEILIIVVLAIVIIGPKDFPIMVRKIGSWVGAFKNYFSEAQKSITDIETYDEDKPSLKLDSTKTNNKEKTKLMKQNYASLQPFVNL